MGRRMRGAHMEDLHALVHELGGQVGGGSRCKAQVHYTEDCIPLVVDEWLRVCDSILEDQRFEKIVMDLTLSTNVSTHRPSQAWQVLFLPQH